MKKFQFYIIRGSISIIYGMLLGLIINRLFGIEWGSAVALSGFCIVIIGSLLAQSRGGFMPLSELTSINENSIDSTSIRKAMDVGTLAEEAEYGLDQSKTGRMVTLSRKKLGDYLFKRSAIELIVAGLVVIAFGASYYVEYFI